MDDLLELIAVEGLYQFMAKQTLAHGAILSREQFAASFHTVVMNVDQLLYCIRIGVVPIPDTSDIQQVTGFRAGKLSLN